MKVEEYRWKPIEDLPDDVEQLYSNELQSLSAIWRDQSENLKESDALQKFNGELGRRWAIETGIIENLYTIDRGTTELLIAQGIQASLIPHGSTDKPVEEVVALLEDQESVLDTIFDFVKQNRSLSTSYVKGLHQMMTANQKSVEVADTQGNSFQTELLRGAWKKQTNNPRRPNGKIHEYCPPEHVASEMDQLIKMHENHVVLDVPPEVESAWLHHRFAQIHPFQDGNGRVARALASLVLLRAGWFPLVIDRDIRNEYIDALELADAGDLSGLVNLFTSGIKKSFRQAISISEDLLDKEQARDQIIQSARDRIEARHIKKLEALQRVFDISKTLEELTLRELHVVRPEIEEIVRLDNPEYFCSCEMSSDANNNHFHNQIVKIARKHKYFSDTGTYRAWVRLEVKEAKQTELVFSFHGVGTDFVGVMAVSAFAQFKDISEEGPSAYDEPHSICRELFQFSYNESEVEVKNRYLKWLHEAINAGLEEWRRGL